MPKSWEEAMSFTGAWDYGYIKAIFEELKVNSIIPKQDILINDTNDTPFSDFIISSYSI